MDQTVKVWDLKQVKYEFDPLVLYDHEDEVIAASIREKDSLLATMDLQGVILVRSIADLGEADQVLYSISTIPKEE